MELTRFLHWSKPMSRAPSRLTCFALTLLAAAAAGAAEEDPSNDPRPADGSPPGESKSYNWGLGVAGLSQQQAYTGIDRNNMAIPLIYFENRWVELFGPWLDIKLPGIEWGEDQALSFTVRTQLFGFDGYEPEDAPILSGMAERKSGIFAGPSVKWRNPVVDVFGEWSFDVSGNSKGQRINFGLERQFHVGERLMFTPSATASWLDRKYADYYYGVRSGEARASRPAYLADSTLNVELSMRTDYLLDQHQAVFVQLGYTMLGTEIKDSPLTDRSGETMALLGYLYRF
jgi:MipA family protein